MLIVVASVLGVLTVPLLGGQLRRLADIRFDRGWTLAGALGLQLLVTSVWPTMPGVAARAAHLASYMLAAWFLWANRRHFGLWIVAAGAATNALAIAVNGGLMPASAAAMRTAGIAAPTGQFANSTTMPHAHLQILGDIFAIPKGWPFANVFSVGDILIVIGAVVIVHTICGTHLPHKRRHVPSVTTPAPSTDNVG